jgi:hypothetical protein
MNRIQHPLKKNKKKNPIDVPTYMDGRLSLAKIDMLLKESLY